MPGGNGLPNPRVRVDSLGGRLGLGNGGAGEGRDTQVRIEIPVPVLRRKAPVGDAMG